MTPICLNPFPGGFSLAAAFRGLSSRALRASLALALLIPGCAGAGTKEAPTTASEMDSSRLSESSEQIDRYPAQELFFALTDDVQCVTLTMLATTQSESITREPEPAHICVIAEKPVQLPSIRKLSYYELSRNVSADWEMKNALTICSIQNNPFQKLSRGVYRVRMTTFSVKPYHLKISLDTTRARFFSSYDDAVEFVRSLNEQHEK